MQGTIVHAEGDDVRSVSVVLDGVLDVACVHVPCSVEDMAVKYVQYCCAHVRAWVGGLLSAIACQNAQGQVKAEETQEHRCGAWIWVEIWRQVDARTCPRASCVW